MKGLIVKKPWIDMHLDGIKPWEIRGSNTRIRGTIGLIESGSGLVMGTVVLTNSFPITADALNQGYKNHRIEDVSIITYRIPYVWEFSSPVRFEEPIPYKHPQGAVIWVNLPHIKLV